MKKRHVYYGAIVAVLGLLGWGVWSFVISDGPDDVEATEAVEVAGGEQE
jgi:hypothetical protein